MDKKIAQDYLCFFICGLLIGTSISIFYFSTLPSSSEIADTAYTHYFEILDNTTVYNAGTNEINAIVNESLASGNDSQRLNKIADLITNNYNDKVVGNYPYLPNSQRYWYDEYGHIRVIPKSTAIETNPYIANVNHKLEFDPNWLIYQKFGACRELSVIFNHTTNKSGFLSRIARAGKDNDSFGVGAAHWWNEIEINGVNKTFDVQWYLQIKTNMSQGSSWSGNRSDYVNNSDGFTPEKLCSWGGVWLTDDQGHKKEDVTHDYMGSYNCSTGITTTVVKPTSVEPLTNIFRIENRTISVKVLL